MAALTPTMKKFESYIAGKVEGNLGFLKAIYGDFSIPNAHRNGPISIPVWTGVTASAIADGTMLQNGMTDTEKALTYKNQAVPLVLPPSSELTLEGRDIAAGLRKGAGELVKNAQSFVIAAACTSTPGSSVTIGSDNFGTDTTWAADIAKVNTMIAYVESVCGQDRANMGIAFHPTAYAGFRSAVDNKVGASFALRNDGILTYQDLPIYSVAVKTGTVLGGTLTGADYWGGADVESLTPAGGIAGFVFHREALACAFTPQGAYLHGGGPLAASDGTTKLIFQGPFAYGVLEDDLLGFIYNP
jgi:hypothetical protein